MKIGLSIVGLITIAIGIFAGFILLDKFSKPGFFGDAELSGTEIMIVMGVAFYHLILGMLCLGVSSILEILEYRCPKCGTILNENNTVCPECKAEFYEGKLKILKSTNAPLEEDKSGDKLTCEHCGAELGEEDNFCPECGKKAYWLREN